MYSAERPRSQPNVPLRLTLAISLAMAIYGMRDYFKNAVEKLFGPTIEQKIDQSFSIEELNRIRETIEKIKRKYPLNKYGFGRLPISTNSEGKFKFVRNPHDPTEGWDCRRISAELAKALMDEGFEAGVAAGSDALEIWQIHYWTYLRKNGKTFCIDLTPPYSSHYGEVSNCPHSLEGIVPPDVSEKFLRNTGSSPWTSPPASANLGYVEKDGRGYFLHVLISHVSEGYVRRYYHVSVINPKEVANSKLAVTNNLLFIIEDGKVVSANNDSSEFLNENPEIAEIIHASAAVQIIHDRSQAEDKLELEFR